MRRLLPEPAADVTVSELMEELRPWEHAHDDRPFTYLNFAVTLDGHTQINGSSREIGSERDTEMLVGLRTRCDAIMIGAGTLRAENYGDVMPDPSKRELREQAGLPAVPLVIIVTGRMELPWDAPLFSDEDGRVLIVTSSVAEPPATAAPVEVTRYDDHLDMRKMLAHLREEGVRALLCEGGPSLHGELHKADGVDELFVTHAPKLAGGHGPKLAEGLNPTVRHLDPVWLVAEPETGELFARYRVSAA
jgi:riboflavin-specific deaminase-like protein